MKSLITLFFAFVSFGLLLAQNDAPIKESLANMSAGTQNGFLVELPGASAEIAENVWKDYIKNFKTKVKKDRKTKEWFADDARIKDLSENSVDIYTMFSSADDLTSATFWFDLGGAYLSSGSHAKQTPAAYAFLQEYGQLVAKEVAKEYLEEQEKEMKRLEKEFEKLQKDKTNYEKKIEDAKALIVEMEANIEENLGAQKIKSEEIDAQAKKVEGAKKEYKKF